MLGEVWGAVSASIHTKKNSVGLKSGLRIGHSSFSCPTLAAHVFMEISCRHVMFSCPQTFGHVLYDKIYD